jgi:glutamate dehydrogenase (NADP+)
MAHFTRDSLTQRYEQQPLFKAAVTEFLDSIFPYLEQYGPDAELYLRLERLLEPERIISFKVVWENDDGELVMNRGYRVQFNSALGPYKGGLRFDPSVNEDVLKFLGFEQIFKNALTGLPLGAGKGGSDFDPKGKSDREIQRFCVAFMTELARHIGPYTDVPAGDIGVGGREIGYLFGAYKRLQNRGDGTLTGKGVGYGGSHVRTEATGYGVVYFITEMLAHVGKSLVGQTAVISGSGNVATHVAMKLLEEGAVPVTLSDRGGYLYAPSGLTADLIQAVQILKDGHGTLKELPLPAGVTYRSGTPWLDVPATVYIPSATQQEIDAAAARAIVEHGAVVVAEGANMPSTLEAMTIFAESPVLFGPAKAVNAGGVAVSGLEMSQNAGHSQWTPDMVDAELRAIMKRIHDTCVRYGATENGIDYVRGANVGGYLRVSEAMKELGW